MSRNKVLDSGVVREFQSEVDAIGEATEPPWARATVFVLTGLLVSIIGLMFLTKIDRVVTSLSGKLVSTERICRLGRTDQIEKCARITVIPRDCAAPPVPSPAWERLARRAG